MFKKLFGTDGIRGKWKDIISPELAFDVGKAVAVVFKREGEINKLIIGKDTRLSSDTLESALISGITSMGANVINLGIVPSAVIPFAIKYHKANAGIMITASHNPKEHNGFKFFNGNGFKISEEQENHIEHIIANSCDYICSNYDQLGTIIHSRNAVKKYIKFVRDELKVCKKTKVCFDCANGCASEIIKEIFKGYNCKYFNNSPNGININFKCGATYVEELQNIMKSEDFDIGFSFDGDADRVRVALKGGKLVSGEDIIYLLTKYNDLKSVVTTKMSNMALYNALEKEDIPCFISDIGENYILSSMLENNSFLGGENNGHYILFNKTTSSDGIFIASQILSIYETNKYLETPFEPYFQLEKAVPTKNKMDIIKNPSLQKTIDICESFLPENGRILVRASGTEEVIRILVEGENKNLVTKITENLSNVIENLANEIKI